MNKATNWKEREKELLAHKQEILKKDYDREINRTRALSRVETLLRHNDPNQTYRVIIDFKIKPSDLRKKANGKYGDRTWRQVLVYMLLQAKWAKNALISDLNSGMKKKDLDYKRRTVKVKVGETDDKTPIFEDRDVSGLSSQMRQGIIDRIGHSMSALKGAKGQGRKVGALKYTSRVNSIYLKQYGRTHWFDEGFRHIKIQGIKRPLKLERNKRLRKILETHELSDIDWTDASIVEEREGDFHVKATAYVRRNGSEASEAYQRKKGILQFERMLSADTVVGESAGGLVPFVDRSGLRVIALDFSTSGVIGEDDVERGWFFPESQAYKEAQRWNQKYRDWTESVTGEAVNSKRQMKIMREEGRVLRARKDDAAYQFVNYLFKIADVVVLQEEQLADWTVKAQGRSEMQHSILGRVKRILMDAMRCGTRPGKFVVMIDKYAPTTKVCADCGQVVPSIPVDVREWVCPRCGARHRRDGNAARVMRVEASHLLDFFGWLRRVNEGKEVKDVGSNFMVVAREGALRALRAIRQRTAGIDSPVRERIGYGQ